MSASRAPEFNSLGQKYMPINLKWVLQRYGIGQRIWGDAVRQMDGKPLSKTATSLLLNYNEWPSRTPVHSIKAQTEALLEEKGVSAEDIATVWDFDPQDRARDQHPAGVHEGQRSRVAPAVPVKHKFIPLEPQMLSEAARKHFSIFVQPFRDDVTSEADVFMTPDIRYVRQAVWMTAKHGGMLAVIADVGTGKTVIRQDFFDRIEREKAPLRVIMPKTIDKRRLTSSAICRAIVKQLAPRERLKQDTEGRSEQAEGVLKASLAAGVQHVLIIEEGHMMTDELFTHLKQFYEMSAGFKKLLSIVIFGQNELDIRLDARANPHIREFINRCEKVHLAPLDTHLEAYLAFKFKRVEASVDRIFEKDAYDAIRARLTVPRRGGGVDSYVSGLNVNNLVTKAMNVCAELGVPKVSAAVIRDL